MKMAGGVALCLGLGLRPGLADAADSAARPAWVEKSDANARVLLDVMARFTPERAGGFGVAGVDRQIMELKPQPQERRGRCRRGRARRRDSGREAAAGGAAAGGARAGGGHAGAAPGAGAGGAGAA